MGKIARMRKGEAPSMQSAEVANCVIGVCNGVLGLECIPTEAGKFVVSYAEDKADASIKFEINKNYFGVGAAAGTLRAKMVIETMNEYDEPVMTVRSVDFRGSIVPE